LIFHEIFFLARLSVNVVRSSTTIFRKRNWCGGACGASLVATFRKYAISHFSTLARAPKHLLDQRGVPLEPMHPISHV
jgi:hypothetical protein